MIDMSGQIVRPRTRISWEPGGSGSDSGAGDRMFKYIELYSVHEHSEAGSVDEYSAEAGSG